jgi:hypothetical protein
MPPQCLETRARNERKSSFGSSSRSSLASPPFLPIPRWLWMAVCFFLIPAARQGVSPRGIVTGIGVRGGDEGGGGGWGGGQLLRSVDLFTVSQAAGALSECSIRNDSNKTLVSAAGAIPLLVTMLQARPLARPRC